MTVFYMMIGVPGAGKSYYAKKLGYPIVSSDDIRLELFGSAEDQTHNNEVFNEVHRRIKEYIANDVSCVYDATNLSRKRRAAFLRELPKDIIKVAIVIATEIDVIYEQNSARERKVPEDVIDKMIKRMQMPRIDEGWSIIRLIPNSKNKKSLENYLEDTKDFDQDNPHHSLSLYDHMVMASEHSQRNIDKYDLSDKEKEIIKNAALFHDIGKPICKTYKTFSGRVDDHAHYYNHAEVGAYLVACSMSSAAVEKFNELPKSSKNMLITWNIEKFEFDYVLLFILVQHHMDYFADEKWIEKIKKNYDERVALMMEIVHEGDSAAY